MNTQGKQRTTKKKVDLHNVVMPLLEAMYTEFKKLSKKKPEGALSKNKIQVVNRLLEKCREVLESEASLQFLDVIDEDSVPQNSDVVLMLSQYAVAMEQFKNTYHRLVGSGFDSKWVWHTSD